MTLGAFIGLISPFVWTLGVPLVFLLYAKEWIRKEHDKLLNKISSQAATDRETVKNYRDSMDREASTWRDRADAFDKQIQQWQKDGRLS